MHLHFFPLSLCHLVSFHNLHLVSFSCNPLDSALPPRFNTAALVGRMTRARGSPRLSVDTFDQLPV